VSRSLQNTDIDREIYIDADRDKQKDRYTGTDTVTDTGTGVEAYEVVCDGHEGPGILRIHTEHPGSHS
jgi:hypothetical protein